MMPKGIPLKFWSETLTGQTTTFASLLGGMVGILILLICGTDVVRRKNLDLENSEGLTLQKLG